MLKERAKPQSNNKVIYDLTQRMMKKEKSLLSNFLLASILLSLIRWGKECPDNSRLLIQDVGPPELDFSPLQQVGYSGEEVSPLRMRNGRCGDVAAYPTAGSEYGGSGEGLWNVQLFRSITSDSAR